MNFILLWESRVQTKKSRTELQLNWNALCRLSQQCLWREPYEAAFNTKSSYFSLSISPTWRHHVVPFQAIHASRSESLIYESSDETSKRLKTRCSGFFYFWAKVLIQSLPSDHETEALQTFDFFRELRSFNGFSRLISNVRWKQIAGNVVEVRELFEFREKAVLSGREEWAESLQL